VLNICSLFTKKKKKKKERKKWGGGYVYGGENGVRGKEKINYFYLFVGYKV
jgi:hypothetical protein